MKLVPLNELFIVTYGNKFDYKNMTFEKDRSIAFIGRTAKTNGVVGHVDRIQKKDPYPAGLITVNLGGAILESFLQPEPFYTAQNIAVLSPKREMTESELLFYCFAIKANKFRYGAFGREANRTLRTLLVPGEIDKKFTNLEFSKPPIEPLSKKNLKLSDREWHWFVYKDIFDFKKGKRLTKENMEGGDQIFIGSSGEDNGVTAHINLEPTHPANVITVSYNGNVGEAFYQPRPFLASDDINILYPKFELNPFIALFLLTVIRKEKFRYNYGRKWHLERMQESKMKLPVNSDGKPDWNFMEDYIKSLRFSSALD